MRSGAIETRRPVLQRSSDGQRQGGPEMTFSARREFFAKLMLIGGFAASALGAGRPAAAQPAGKRFVKREASERSGYSQAVVTQGGRTIWLAGHTGAVDAAGQSLA